MFVRYTSERVGDVAVGSLATLVETSSYEVSYRGRYHRVRCRVGNVGWWGRMVEGGDRWQERKGGGILVVE